MSPKLNSFAVLLALLGFFNQLPAQTKGGIQIRGRVTNEKYLGVENADVFLAHTTLGTKTDQYGNFKIRNVPTGTCDLVVAMTGYRLRKFTIMVDATRKNSFSIRLKPKTVMPVTEESKRNKKKWQKNVAKFTKEILSTTANSHECKLMNPEVLAFPKDRPAVFKAVANGTLIFENQALGYKVIYILQEFEVTSSFTKYNGIPRFEELTPKDEQEERKWRLNRLRAYRGSTAHFFATLLHNYITARGVEEENTALKKEGFMVEMIMGPGSTVEDAYSTTTSELSKYREINVNDYITPNDDYSQFQLVFPYYWQVTYSDEPEEEEYLRHIGINPNLRQQYERVNRGGVSGDRRKRFSGTSDQKSLIKLSGESLTIKTAGAYYDLFGLEIYDYWSWQRLADILPKGYTMAVAKVEEVALGLVEISEKD